MVLYLHIGFPCVFIPNQNNHTLSYTHSREISALFRYVRRLLLYVDCMYPHHKLLLLLRYCWFGRMLRVNLKLYHQQQSSSTQYQLSAEVPILFLYSQKHAFSQSNCSSVQARRLARTDVPRTYFFTYHEHTGTQLSLVGITDVFHLHLLFHPFPTTHPYYTLWRPRCIRIHTAVFIYL